MEVACGEHGDNILRLALAVRDGILDEKLSELDKIKGEDNGETPLVIKMHPASQSSQDLIAIKVDELDDMDAKEVRCKSGNKMVSF